MLYLSSPLFSTLASRPPYLDPGSGSFLLQLLIAGLAGIGLFIGASWSKIKRFFHRRNSEMKPDEEEDEYDD